MNLPFLYVKKYAGVIDDSEDPLWFMSKEYSAFTKDISESNTQLFVKTMLSIFEKDCPNSYRLLEAFSRRIEKEGNTLYIKNAKRQDMEMISISHDENTYFNHIESIVIKFYNNISDVVRKVFNNISDFEDKTEHGIIKYNNIYNTSKIKEVRYNTYNNTLSFSL